MYTSPNRRPKISFGPKTGFGSCALCTEEIQVLGFLHICCGTNIKADSQIDQMLRHSNRLG